MIKKLLKYPILSVLQNIIVTYNFILSKTGQMGSIKMACTFFHYFKVGYVLNAVNVVLEFKVIQSIINIKEGQPPYNIRHTSLAGGSYGNH